jgi:CheY-like chemotaxis protein
MHRSSGSRSARLLLVEDSPAHAQYLREIFKEAKIRNHLHHAPDAEAALVHLASNTPDLVLLDMHLPGMQGEELIRAIRADARLSSMPIVALAASELHAERMRQEGVEAHCCLLKPISVHALLEWVTRIDTLAVALVTEGEAA